MDLSRYQIDCADCGDKPYEDTVADAPSGYKIVKCSCGKETCIDTNEVVVWQDWFFKNQAA